MIISKDKIQLNIKKAMGTLAKVQKMIDTAAAKGKDISALQAALDAFEAAAKKAKPTYESMNGIVNSHQGFDAYGKVTGAEKAKSTVQERRTKMQAVKTAMTTLPTKKSFLKLVE